MAQKKFKTDSGFQVGDHFIQETTGGDLIVTITSQITQADQKPFLTDHGLKIGDWQFYQDSDEALNVSTTGNIDSSQFPFIADGGVRIGDNWTISQTSDGDLKLEQLEQIESSSPPSNIIQPSYSLTSNVSEVNEGGAVIITLSTTYVNSGTTLPYTISGVTSADIGGASLTGNFTVGSSETLTLSVTEDAVTEGSELMNVVLDNGEASVSVTINDTSIEPVATYALSSSADIINENSTFTITLSTSNVANGTDIAYTITGVSSADINNASLTGVFNVQSNTSQLVLQTTADLTTEGTEILNLSLDNGEDDVSVAITDSSIAPPPPPDFTTFGRQSGGVLTPPTAYGYDKYGGSVAMTDIDTIIAAHSYSDRDSLANAGDVVINEWNGSNWTANRTTVRPTDIGGNDQFGYQVAADPSGTTKFAASSPYWDGDETNQGAVYIFAKSGGSWSQEIRLVPTNHSTGHSNHFLGQALAMDGNYVVAAAPYDRSGSGGAVGTGGTAWLWENTTGSTWTQNWRITGADANLDTTGLGKPGTVAIDATAGLVVLGSPEYSSNSGTAKVYNLGGTLLATLSTGSTQYEFGNYVAVSGDKIAVYGTVGANTQGRVYIFQNTSGNTWTLRQTINDGTGGSGHYGFGKGLRMIGDNLIILETDADPNNVNSDPGSVHMYQWNSSTNQFDAKDEEHYQQSTDHKGINVNALAMAIDGTNAIVITGKNIATSYNSVTNYGQVIIYDNQ